MVLYINLNFASADLTFLKKIQFIVCNMFHSSGSETKPSDRMHGIYAVRERSNREWNLNP